MGNKPSIGTLTLNQENSSSEMVLAACLYLSNISGSTIPYGDKAQNGNNAALADGIKIIIKTTPNGG